MKKINLVYIMALLVFHSCSYSGKGGTVNNLDNSIDIRLLKGKKWTDLDRFQRSGKEQQIRIYRDSIIVIFERVDTLIYSFTYHDYILLDSISAKKLSNLSLEQLRKTECFYDTDSLNFQYINFYDDKGRKTGLEANWFSNGQLHYVYKNYRGRIAQGYRYRYYKEGSLRQLINTSDTGKFPMKDVYWDKEGKIIFYQEIDSEANADGYGYRYEKGDDMSYFINTSTDYVWDKSGYTPIDSIDWIKEKSIEQPEMIYTRDLIKAINM